MRFFILLMCCVTSLQQAFAQSWPTRPIKILVPYTAGGSSDYTARTLADRLGPLLGTQVVVENRPGGNTVIATEAAVKSPADGYTVLFGIDTAFTVNPHIYKTMPFKPSDLKPVMVMASSVSASRCAVSACVAMASLIREARTRSWRCPPSGPHACPRPGQPAGCRASSRCSGSRARAAGWPAVHAPARR